MKIKHLGRKILLTILVLILLVLGGFYAMFHNEISTLMTIEKVDDNTLYTMEYKGDYGFDEFLKQGASNDGELVAFVTERLLKGIPLKFSIPNLGCSTFRAELANGEQIFGRNFDLTYSPALFVKTEPDNGYASLSTVNLAFLGYNEEKLPDTFKKQIITLAAPYAPLDGINEKGVAIGVLLIPTDATHQETEKIDITTTTAVRLVLDKAASVEEAVELLKQYDMHSSANSSYHFQISDATGASVVVEYVDNEISIVEQEGSFQAATNFLLTPGDFDFGHGQDRFEILDTTLTEKNGMLADEQAGMDLLEAVAQDWHENSRGQMSATQWSIVYNTTNKTAKVAVGRQFDTIHQFNLED